MTGVDEKVVATWSELGDRLVRAQNDAADWKARYERARVDGFREGVRAMADLVWNDLEGSVDILANQLFEKGPK